MEDNKITTHSKKRKKEAEEETPAPKRPRTDRAENFDLQAKLEELQALQSVQFEILRKDIEQNFTILQIQLKSLERKLDSIFLLLNDQTREE